MSKHTPGPWKIVTCDGSHFDIVSESSEHGCTGIDVHLVINGGIKDPKYFVLPKEAEANARLIAAAPDLLAACNVLLMALGLAVGEPLRADDSSVVQARAAIAKAEGKS